MPPASPMATAYVSPTPSTAAAAMRRAPVSLSTRGATRGGRGGRRSTIHNHRVQNRHVDPTDKRVIARMRRDSMTDAHMKRIIKVEEDDDNSSTASSTLYQVTTPTKQHHAAREIKAEPLDDYDDYEDDARFAEDASSPTLDVEIVEDAEEEQAPEEQQPCSSRSIYRSHVHHPSSTTVSATVTATVSVTAALQRKAAASKKRRGGLPDTPSTWRKNERMGRETSQDSSSTDGGESLAKKKKTYTWNNGTGEEKFRTDILERIKNGNPEYDWLEQVNPTAAGVWPGMIKLTDGLEKWKAHWAYGVQVPLRPKEIHKFDTAPCDIPRVRRLRFILPRKYLFSRDAPYREADTLQEVFPPPDLRLYEGDRLDELWLELLNKSREEKSAPKLEMYTMLLLMNEYELACYNKIHKLLWSSLDAAKSKEDENGIDEDAPCAVCYATDMPAGEDMIFCDGCNRCVHLSCYGLDGVPAEGWFCDMCFHRPGRKLRCALCTSSKGMMKRVVGGKRWAHIACALWIPEVRFYDVDHRDQIGDLDKILPERKKLACEVCSIRHGAVIQCSHRRCMRSFHVTCGQDNDYHMEISEVSDPDSAVPDDIVFTSYCGRHTKDHKREAQRRERAIAAGETYVENDEDEEEDERTLEQLSLEERGDRLAEQERIFYLHVQHQQVAKKLGVLEIDASDVYEYWKQKRAENGGQPLLRSPETELIDEDKETSEPVSDDNDDVIDHDGPMRQQARTESDLVTPIQKKMFRYEIVHQKMDAGRNALFMVMKRERLKKEMLEARYDLFKHIRALEAPPFHVPISQRAINQYVDVLEADATPDEIAESNKRAERLREAIDASARKRSMTSPPASPNRVRGAVPSVGGPNHVATPRGRGGARVEPLEIIVTSAGRTRQRLPSRTSPTTNENGRAAAASPLKTPTTVPRAAPAKRGRRVVSAVVAHSARRLMRPQNPPKGTSPSPEPVTAPVLRGRRSDVKYC